MFVSDLLQKHDVAAFPGRNSLLSLVSLIFDVNNQVFLEITLAYEDDEVTRPKS
jgi:hypothetical protein